MCVCSQIFPISSKDDLADGPLPFDSTDVGGGSLITTPPRSKSHNSISEASWLFWLASADFARDDVTTHSSLSHNDNAKSVLIGRIYDYFLNFLVYIFYNVWRLYTGTYSYNKTIIISILHAKTPPRRADHNSNTRVLTRLYIYIQSPSQLLEGINTSITIIVSSLLRQTACQMQSSNTPIFPEWGNNLFQDNFIMLFLVSRVFTKNDSTGHENGDNRF